MTTRADIVEYTKNVIREKELDALQRSLEAKRLELEALTEQQNQRNRHIIEKSKLAGVTDINIEVRMLPDNQLTFAAALLDDAKAYLSGRKIDPGMLTPLTSYLMDKARTIDLPGPDKKNIVLYTIEKLTATQSGDLEYGYKFAKNEAANAVEELFKASLHEFKVPTFNERKYDPSLEPEIEDLVCKGRDYLAGRQVGPSVMPELTSFLMEQAKPKPLRGADKKEIVIEALKRLSENATDRAYNTRFVNESAEETIKTLFIAAGTSALYHMVDSDKAVIADRQLGVVGVQAVKGCCTVM